MKRIIILLMFLVEYSVFAEGSWLSVNGAMYSYTQTYNLPALFTSPSSPESITYNSNMGLEFKLFLALRRHGNFGVYGSYSSFVPNDLIYEYNGNIYGWKFDFFNSSSATNVTAGLGYCYPFFDTVDVYLMAGPGYSGFVFQPNVAMNYRVDFYSVEMTLGSRIHLSQHVFLNVSGLFCYSFKAVEKFSTTGYPDKSSDNIISGFGISPQLGLGISWGRKKGE